MVFRCLTLIILLFLLNLFSLSQTTRFCSYNKVPCEPSHRNDKWLRWCCKIHEICGEDYGQCLTSSLGGCIRLCLSYRPEPNENLSNNIPALSYQPISIIVSSISVEEESPPSYEEVMNDNNLFPFENLE